VISPNPNHSISLDHFNFRDFFLVSNNQKIVEIESGVNLTQCVFEGHQSWNCGTYGLYWVDTTTTQVSNGLVLKNIRSEQGQSASAYTVYVEHHYGLQTLVLKNCYMDIHRNGLHARNVKSIVMDGVYHPGTTNVALDIDSTCDVFETRGSFFNAGCTVNMPDHQIAFATPTKLLTGSPLYGDAVYQKSSSTLPTLVGGALGNKVSDLIASGGLYGVGSFGMVCLLLVLTSESISALFAINGSNTTYLTGTSSGFFSNTKDTASKVNVYYSSDNSRFELQNNRASSIRVMLLRFGSLGNIS
jgi:hypothetical protein